MAVSLALASLLADAAVAAPAPACGRVWSALPNSSPSSRDSFLKGVTALSAADAWAVGALTDERGFSRTLAEHWDGSSWTVVPTVNPGQGAVLTAVAAVARDDVWAVGYYFEPTSMGPTFVPLIEHWDGSAWTSADVPQVKGKYLNDVTATAADDVWAVGDGTAMHWDGTSWTLLNHDQSMSTTSAVAATDLWAAGPFTMRHWDGEAWASIGASFPGDESWVQSLAAIGQGDVWGVGSYSYYVRDNAQPSRTLAVHWDGAAWSVVSSPNATGASELAGVDAVSSGDVWAVGHSDAGALVEHWDGKRWRVVRGIAAPGDQVLLDTSATDDGAVFAVGYAGSGMNYHAHAQRLCEMRVSDGGFSPATTSAGAGKDVFWNIARDAAAAHGVRDSSGLRLFNSGLLPPGGSYGFAYKVAGTYAVTEAPGGTRGTVRVPLSVSMAGGSFTLGWGQPDAGFVVDVQVTRPGSAGFTDWLTGLTTKRGTFSADAGPGTYWFRARLRNAVSGASSDWSPVAAGTIS